MTFYDKLYTKKKLIPKRILYNGTKIVKKRRLDFKNRK